MILTIDYTVAFLLPEENKAVEKFIKENDMTQWTEDATTGMICFHKHDIYMTEKGESE